MTGGLGLPHALSESPIPAAPIAPYDLFVVNTTDEVRPVAADFQRGDF